MNSAQRTLHEAYDFALKALKVPLRLAQTSVEAGAGESVPIQESGELTLDNSLEAGFYGMNTASRVLKWEKAESCRLKNVYVVGDTGQIFLEDGRLFLPTFHPHEHLLHRMKVRRPIRALARRIEHPVFHLTGRNHENRGHFLMQHLPRLLAARGLLESVPDHKILLAPGHVRWQSRYLDMLGFDTGRVVEGSQGTLFIRDLLYVPHIYGSHALARPDLCLQIRDAALRLGGSPASGPSLFISRKDAPDKRLLNEDAIVEEARKLLGEVLVIELGKYNLARQTALFSAAPVVLGPIGQGLCNNIFMKGNLLVSLVPGNSVDGHMSDGHTTVAAQVCGNQAITLCSGSNEGLENNRSNWIFPEEHFRKQLSRLLAFPQLQSIRDRLLR